MIIISFYLLIINVHLIKTFMYTDPLELNLESKQVSLLESVDGTKTLREVNKENSDIKCEWVLMRAL